MLFFFWRLTLRISSSNLMKGASGLSIVGPINMLFETKGLLIGVGVPVGFFVGSVVGLFVGFGIGERFTFTFGSLGQLLELKMQ